MTEGAVKKRVWVGRVLSNKMNKTIVVEIEGPEPGELAQLRWNHPGQAVAVTIPERGSEHPFLRYYSLASPPRSSKRLSLLLNSADQGKGSSLLLEHEVGHEFQITGPYGSFVLQEDLKGKLIWNSCPS